MSSQYLTPEECAADVAEFSRLLERLTRHFEETEQPRSLPILMSLVPARMVNVIRQYVREEMRRVDQEQCAEESTPDLVIDEGHYERGRSTEFQTNGAISACGENGSSS